MSWIHPPIRTPPLLLSALLLLPAPALGLTPDQVLIVANERSPISRQIAEYYQRARRIPDHHVIRIRTDPREEIDRDTFRREIVQPVAAHLLEHRLPDQILAIVLTKGVPLKIRGTGGPNGTQASVDSDLALLYREMVEQPTAPENGIRNPYFQPGKPVPFSRADHDIYLVTRLDGYTWEDIQGLIDRGTSAERRGKVVLDMKSPTPVEDSRPGDGWLREAARRLRGSGLEVVLDQSAHAVTGQTDVIGYASWGSNDPAIKARVPGFRWLPGAIASWFVSTSARTFTAPPAGWSIGAGYAGSGQSLIGDLIAEGVTGVVGFVYEPYLEATAQPQIFLPAYRAGFTLAESFYMSLPTLSWQAVVIGDPLVAPFAPPATPPPPRPPGALLFLQRRAVFLEKVAARTSSPEVERARALTYTGQAEEMRRLQRLDEALTLARRAVAIKADEPKALYILAIVHVARGESDEATAAFRTLLSHDSASPFAREAERWLAR
jgi:uncharacterized protein (TIGR03790 family)